MSCSRSFLILAMLSGVYSTTRAQRTPTPEELVARANSGLQSSVPQGFEENKGQVVTTTGEPAPFVRYRLSQENTHIFLLSKGIAYQFSRPHLPEGYLELKGKKLRDAVEEAQLDAMEAEARLETYRMDVELEDADPNAAITTEGRSLDYTNYYNHDALDVHTYGKVVYHNVYPGIDWVLALNGAGFTYDFVVRPGGDPSRIKLRFKDHEELFVDAAGKLTHGNRLGRFTEEKPVSFQGGSVIDTRFALADDLLRFDVGEYDERSELTIDPPRLWGTYYGGTADEYAFSVDVSTGGSIYLAGMSNSSNAIATPGAQQTSWAGEDDAMLVKFNASGVRQWGTYYGGPLGDAFSFCKLNGTWIYAAGISRSTTGVATTGSHQIALGGDWDGMLVKFDTNGVRMWGTYYGGTLEDRGRCCTVDPSGNVYMAGFAMSSGASVIASNPPVHQATFGGGSTGQSYSRGDAFLVKFNASGVRQWGTYYGGASDDEALGCATDGSGNVYIAGGTGTSTGTSIATAGSHQAAFGTGGSDAFLAKFNSSGTRLWGTYYGGSGSDYGFACSVDPSDNVFVAGDTQSSNAIASGGHQGALGGSGVRNAFFVKFNSGGTRQWGTYYGGAVDESGRGCATDGDGNSYLIGESVSTTGIAFNGHQMTFGGGEVDAYLAEFAPNGTRTLGTYYGGTLRDEGYSAVVDGDRNIYLCGRSLSTNAISTAGSHQAALGGASDAFLVKFGDPVDCLGVPNGTALPGTSCDDDNGCTMNDTWSAACACAGTAVSGPTMGTVGGNSPLCADDVLNLTAAATGLGTITYLWTGPNGFGSGAQNPSINNATVAATGTYTVTASNGCGTNATATVQILVNPHPSTATVGGNQTICVNSTTTGLGGNTPQVGTGAWSVVSGGTGTFSPNATTPNATFTHTGGAGPVVVRWTISLAPCQASSANVTITITQPPSSAVAGPAQTICTGGTTAGLGGNTPTSGTGQWTVVTGGAGTFSPNQNTGNATFTPNQGSGPYLLRWTTSNAPCNADTADVTITVNPLPSTATAGNDQTICVNGTTIALGGNTPQVGTGTWSVVSGGTGTFSNAAAPNATFTHTGGAGPVVLRWTISNAPCTASAADVTITINTPPTATAGGAQTICANGTTAGLGGNTVGTGAGLWSVVGGGTGTFSPNAGASNATFTHVSGVGPIILRWTVSSAPCAPSTADVTITINQPPTAATTGGGQTICANGTSTGLGGNAPNVGTGAWSVVSGGTGTFSNTAAPNATFTHTGGAGPVVLRWTISNAPCIASATDVTITINQPPTAATVGGPQTICTNGTTTGLGANTPTVGTGAWSIVSGGAGTFSNAASPNATFTHTGGTGPVILRWTISNAPCSASSANVTITINPPPTTAVAGNPQTICSGGTTTGLGGNTPTIGTGVWTVVSGGTGTFSNAGSPSSTFTHTSGTGPVIVRWTISNAPCSASTDEVSISINQPPSTATAGGPQTLCAGGTASGLGGNAPSVGTGAWSVVSGGTGTFSDPASPNSTFTHTSGSGPVIVRWTISNAPCTPSSANVTITINQPPSTATTGGSQTICANGTTNGLGGNTPSIGTGSWSVVSGGTGTFSNASSPNATFTHTGGTGPVILRWTITNAPCAASTANVTITISPDTDGDGICDVNDDCPNVTGQQGDDCDDGNALTINDVLSPTCICTGTPVSCVTNGQCNDNDPCTSDACVSNACVYTPLPDADGDGLCDAQDPCPSLANVEPGDPCDDGIALTINDQYTANCACAGTPVACVVNGDCDDENACTNDACVNNACVHTPLPDSDSDGLCDAQDPCPLLANVQPGDDCDDGVALTINDQYTVNCVCAGTTVGCVVNGDCNDNDACTSDACVNNACVYTPLPDGDGDGLCDAQDPCPLLANIAPGAPCDDGNALTIDDQYTTACVCAGTAVGCVVNGDCTDNNACTSDACVNNACVYTPLPDGDADGLCDALDPCPLLANVEPGDPCDDGVALTINDQYTANCVCAGTAVGCVVNGDCDDQNACTSDACVSNACVHTPLPDADGDGICDAQDPCPLMANIEPGDPCDDGDALTVDDQYTADCQCSGTTVSCVVSGDCNDNDICTSDACVSNTCVYTPLTADGDGDGIPDCSDPCPTAIGVPGSDCDDNDPCTSGDVLNANCQCTGTPDSTDSDGDGTTDCIDTCPFIIGVAGGPCTDGNPCTVNDVLSLDCICSGTQAVVGPINGDNSIPGFTNNTYTIPVIPGATYAWTLPTSWSSSNTTSNNLTAFTQNGPATVELCVNAYLAGCTSLDSVCQTIVVFQSVGIGGPDADDGPWFTIRPNPSRGVFELVRTDNGRDAFQATVMDAVGQMVPMPPLQAGRRVSTIDLANLAPGAYFLRVTLRGKTQVIRLMIER